LGLDISEAAVRDHQLSARSGHTIGWKIDVRMTGFKVQPPSDDGRSSAPISVSVLPELILLE
jgi:hypothetical protein